MSENPEAFVVGGPNGAGKTTFIKEFLTEYEMTYIAADRIAEEINPDDPESAAIEAGREFLNRIRQQIQSEEPFIVESTLSGKTFRKFYKKMSEYNYSITTFFLYLNSPDQHVKRVRERTARGGHHVPEEDVRRRYKRAIQNFWEIYRLLSIRWILVNNSGNTYTEIAVGEKEVYNVYEEERFQSFLESTEK